MDDNVILKPFSGVDGLEMAPAKIQRPVPSLSTDGWVNDLNIRLKKLFYFYLVNTASQTTTFKGHVINIKEVLSLNLDPLETAKRIEDDLKIFLDRYFSSVEIEIYATDLDEENNTQTILNFNITVTDNGESFLLQEDFNITDLENKISFIHEN